MNNIKNISNAKISFFIEENFTESILEMIEDKELMTEEEIKEYMLECLYEDINNLSSNLFKFGSQAINYTITYGDKK